MPGGTPIPSMKPIMETPFGAGSGPLTVAAVTRARNRLREVAGVQGGCTNVTLPPP